LKLLSAFISTLAFHVQFIPGAEIYSAEELVSESSSL